MMSAFAYMLRCADGSFYVGSARGENFDKRMGEHQSGSLGGYTSARRPVELVYAEQFQFITDAVAAERRIKGWSRAKKQALIGSDWDRLRCLAKRPGARGEGGTEPPHPEVLGAAGPRRTHQPHPDLPAKRALKDIPDPLTVLRGPAAPGASA